MSDREDDGSGSPPGGLGVGYGKPPIDRRFKPGQSGNTKGRPKGAKNRRSIVAKVANEMHCVIENGKRRRRSTLELIVLRLRNSAIVDGNVRAFDEHHRLGKTYGTQEVSDHAGVMIAPAEMTPEEWVAEQQEKNKTRQPPPDYRPDEQ
ncbi:MAG: DUF5681 domain-containing protein [Pseudomonadota bacterium]